ncbi:imidazole glycerol phosphate synthase subunit HisH [Oceaniradius stylonematis]|uniref:imidazole glycerol phosphate synthase subunit HisH n=1 Tax=Oceaniradius stylonematis TaxID=2184161 RepID=UPI003C7A5459
MKHAAVIDYGMGNISSVLNACEHVGIEARLTKAHNEIRDAAGIILPGVGAFGDAMDALEGAGLVEIIQSEVSSGKPFMGMCLGMQLIATKGTEFGERSGIGLIDGAVERLDVSGAVSRTTLPHIGWNTVTFQRSDGMFAGLGDSADFYFVHSFALRPKEPSIIAGLCDHGETFVAAIESDNVWAAQFHPEKSQKSGLALMANWREKLLC